MRVEKMIKFVKNSYLFISFIMLISLLGIVGCSTSSSSSVDEDFGTITGSLLDATNSNLIASNGAGEYLIPVDSYGRFSANIPAGTYTLSYRESSTNKLVLTNRTIVVANNVTINIVDADLVPQPQVLTVSIPLVNSDSAIIEWETDIESDGYLEYGTNELYGITTYVSTDLTTQHRVQITALMPNTTYHFRIIASRHNLDSAKFISRDYTFTTTNN